MQYKTRETWENYVGNQSTVPFRTYSPSSLVQLIQLIKEAEKLNLTVRAVGSGHSFSDVALVDGFLVRPEGLNKIFNPLQTSLFKDGTETRDICHFESGVTIRELNTYLDKHELALPNMGGYDGQTFVGAMATSTHGSGLRFGPFSDFALSIETVSDGGILYRVEPSDGITDRAKYEEKYPPGSSGRVLVQDDDWFNALKVSMGCMGIIYSIIIRVRNKYWLKEVGTPVYWRDVKKELKKGDVLKQHDHYELMLNPYVAKGEDDHLCLAITRSELDAPPKINGERIIQNFFSMFKDWMPFIEWLLIKFLNKDPKITPEVINEIIKGSAEQNYSDISYKVYNIGVANYLPAYSQEIGFPMKDDLYIAAIDRYLELTRECQDIGELYITSPSGVRFVKGNNAFLSPQYGGDTCMLEVIVGKGTTGAFQMYQRFERELYAFSGRPHWGQINTLTGSHDFIASMYPEYKKWMAVYHELNKKGTFNSPFGKRVGFEKETFG
ncbi:MAG: FAD-binding protein [bacterium]|nr:FAD-binding protein [bacterium]